MELGFVILDRELRVRGVGPSQPGLPWTAGLLVDSELTALAAASVDDELIEAARSAVSAGSMHERMLRSRDHAGALRRVQAIRGSDKTITGVLVTWTAMETTDKSAVDLQFLSVLTHDLRTPLGALTLWARLLAQEENDAAQTREGAEMIHRSVEELRDQIDDLGDIARLLAGRAGLVERDFALRPLLFGAVESQRSAAEEAGLVLTAELDPALGIVRADPARIQQVVTNLLTNAIRFTPVHGRIAVVARRDGAEIELTVADSGAGIPPQMLPVIFDRSAARASVSGESRRGLGLGLPVVREIANLCGGRVDAESTGAGQGSTFRVRLPLPPVAGKATRSGWMDSGPLWRGKTVLVIGGNPGLGDALRLREAEVVTASHATAASQVLADQRVDAMVVECGTPDCDPIELVRDARATGGGSDGEIRRIVPSVALGFPPAGAAARRALQVGFAVCLPRESARETVITALELAFEA